MKGDVAAKDAALRQHAESSSTAERDKKKTEAELQSQNNRLNRALEEVVKFRKLLEESKVRASFWFSEQCLDTCHIAALNYTRLRRRVPTARRQLAKKNTTGWLRRTRSWRGKRQNCWQLSKSKPSL